MHPPEPAAAPPRQPGRSRPAAPCCFVVMPFGHKTSGPGGEVHDFDKIYRVVIRRAVERAGMTCVRADETTGSRLIHTDMFRDLRDRPLVIADLTLQNPNVLYELGVRHVMSKTGTVLMCERRSTPLPFDIGLSRVVLYDYDGTSLDWEEAERLVEQLRIALLESATGAPDSPVHALLERVHAIDAADAAAATWSAPARNTIARAELEPYIALVAAQWLRQGDELEPLFAAHRGTVFGCCALSHRLQQEATLPAALASRVANQLLDLAQYDRAAELYERLRAEGPIGYADLVRFADAYGKVHQDLAGADRGLSLMAEAMAAVERQFGTAADTPEGLAARAYCTRRKAGVWQWRWELSRETADLREAIAAHAEAIELLALTRRSGGTWAAAASGPLAQAHMRRLLLGRIIAEDDGLGDAYGDIPAILEIQERPGDDAKASSYLRWYRSIALADSGAADRARRSALEAFARDADLMNQGPEFVEIGRRQYVGLRRVLEAYARWLRHPELVGFIGQTLQARH